MPIEPPNPHKILDNLRAIETQLRALAAALPSDPLVKVALGSVEVAQTAVHAIAEREQRPAA